MFKGRIIHALYKKLFTLYPQRFRERLGESMQQTFNDLYTERKQQTERGLFGYPINLVLAITILIFIVTFVGGIVVDQYPCWIGVPNCD